MFDLAGNLPGALGSNSPEFPDSCLFEHLGVIENIDQMLVDLLKIQAKQLAHWQLAHPQVDARDTHLHPAIAVRPRVDDNLIQPAT